MSQLDYYRTQYEYEIFCNHKMLAMLESVPDDRRTESRFQQAVSIADHLAACREKWLDYMIGNGSSEIPWRDEQANLLELRPRFAALESCWTDYLARLEPGQLSQDFEFTESDGEVYRLPIEVQIVQLIGHASYHRGQVALLVNHLGGEIIDTDYADWWWTAQKVKN